MDLGELAPVKAAVPELAALEPEEAGRRLRRILTVARRVGLVGAVARTLGSGRSYVTAARSADVPLVELRYEELAADAAAVAARLAPALDAPVEPLTRALARA